MKPAVKGKTGATLRMTRKMFSGHVPHEMLLTTRQKTRLHNKFSNQLAINIKLSKTRISKLIQSVFIEALLSKLAYSVMRIAALLPKNILLPSHLTAVAVHARIQKKVLGSGENSNIHKLEMKKWKIL